MGALQGSLRTARVKTKHSNRGARIYDRNFYFLVQPGKFFLQSRAGPYMTSREARIICTLDPLIRVILWLDQRGEDDGGGQ